MRPMKHLVVFGFAIGLAMAPLSAEAATYIRIQKSDSVWKKGQVAYRVNSGDILKVMKKSKCIHDAKKTCWRVKNTKSGKDGFVEADHMKRNHQIFKK